MTSALIEPDARRKLVSLLGQFSHANDHVVAAAARKIEELRVRLDFQWHELLAPAALPAPGHAESIEDALNRQAFVAVRDPVLQASAAARVMLGSSLIWTAWEREFLSDMEARAGVALSQRQAAQMRKLWAKFRAEVRFAP